MSAGSFPDVNLQLGDGVAAADLPAVEEFAIWITAAVTAGHAQPPLGCVTLRMVSPEESAELNSAWRDKAGPTNILAFPAGPALLPAEVAEAELGDLVICLQVARQEAVAQGKTLAQHLAHLTVHGTLHLLGYDHQSDPEAARMEALESRILAGMGLPDPYLTPSEDAGQNGNN